MNERKWIKFARYSKLDNCIGKAQQVEINKYESPEGSVVAMDIILNGIRYAGRLVQVKEDEEE
jgi:hypothetical protein